jgi:ferredoxin
VKIKLDRTVCDGFGICALHAPETFSLDEWGYASLVGAGNVEPGHEDGVHRALLDCPVHAITVLEPAARALTPNHDTATR